jgi:hypothetical protein
VKARNFTGTVPASTLATYAAERSWLFFGSGLGADGRVVDFNPMAAAMEKARRLRARGRMVWIEAAGQPARGGR